MQKYILVSWLLYQVKRNMNFIVGYRVELNMYFFSFMYRVEFNNIIFSIIIFAMFVIMLRCYIIEKLSNHETSYLGFRFGWVYCV